MPAWEQRDDCITGLQCNIRPKCLFCGTPLAYFTLKIHKFGINDGSGGLNSHAIDFEFGCPECGFWSPWGVAIDAAHYERVMKAYPWIHVEGAYDRENVEAGN